MSTTRCSSSQANATVLFLDSTKSPLLPHTYKKESHQHCSCTRQQLSDHGHSAERRCRRAESPKAVTSNREATLNHTAVCILGIHSCAAEDRPTSRAARSNSTVHSGHAFCHQKSHRPSCSATQSAGSISHAVGGRIRSPPRSGSSSTVASTEIMLVIFTFVSISFPVPYSLTDSLCNITSPLVDQPSTALEFL